MSRSIKVLLCTFVTAGLLSACSIGVDSPASPYSPPVPNLVALKASLQAETASLASMERDRDKLLNAGNYAASQSTFTRIKNSRQKIADLQKQIADAENQYAGGTGSGGDSGGGSGGGGSY